MLRQRVLTAVVLLVILGAALAWPGPWPFVIVLSVATGCALWEWLRLTAADTPAAALAGVAMAALTLVQAWTWLDGTQRVGLTTFGLVVRLLVPLVCAAWLLGVSVVVARGRVGPPARSPVLSLFAILALYAAWASLVLFFLAFGARFVLSLLVLVWVADIAAYFAGRSLGRRKLAPRVSPGKTLEGALAGVLAAVAWIAVSSRWPGTYGHALVQHWSLGVALLWAALLAVVSIEGDLFESLLKRRAGRKDSSGLLPGHGGVFDRIDALLPVAPLALLLSGAVF